MSMAKKSKPKLSTFQIIIFSFAALILAGTMLLMLPFASKSGEVTPFSDALFTATSAVCVTGLVVQDTATYWSIFGQGTILFLLQIGGLGIIKIVTTFSLLSGRKISLLERSTIQDALSTPQVGGVVKLIRFVIISVGIFEVAGALAMLPSFCRHFGLKGIWMSFFHSVSAFCNAGFDIMGEHTGKYSSLTFFHDDILVVTVVCLLIIIGGIGFLTWDDFAAHKFRFKKYRMQSKIVLVTSAALIVVPFIILFFTEYQNLPMKDRICSALFQTVTTRTAGMNTQDLTTMTPASTGLMIGLMLTGGSPGSTAGGMKTTTIAILLINAVCVFRRKKSVEAFGRRIEDGVVRLAATIITLYVTLAGVGAIIISIIEGLPISVCLFETASAVGTVGLSLGITPALSIVPRIILIALMFFGRVGGLTLIYAAVSTRGADMSHYPVEKITVG